MEHTFYILLDKVKIICKFNKIHIYKIQIYILE